MRTTSVRLTALIAILVTPAIVAAQGPARGAMGPDAPRPLGDAGVTQILNSRRVLELTPRQVAQLDSIERVVFADRRAAETRMRGLRESIRMQVESQGVPANDAERAQRREAIRTRLEALRPQMQQMRGRDSVARAAANRVLNDAQRQQLREIRAEQRGRAQGMREARMREGRGGPAGRGGMAGPRGEMRRRQMIERGMGERRMMGPGGRRMAPGDSVAPADRQARERAAMPRRPEIDG